MQLGQWAGWSNSVHCTPRLDKCCPAACASNTTSWMVHAIGSCIGRRQSEVVGLSTAQQAAAKCGQTRHLGGGMCSCCLCRLPGSLS